MLLLIIAGVAFLYFGTQSRGLTPDLDSHEYHFRNFISKFKKDYVPGTTVYKERLNIFQMNYQYANKLTQSDKSNKSAFYGITKFSDLTHEEFQNTFLCGKTSKLKNEDKKHRSFSKTRSSDDSLPEKWDWRSKGVISAPRNQKSCGGCWAFSSTECVESMKAIKTGELALLSVQELIDCSVGYKHLLGGCSGGDTCTAFDWLMKTPLISDGKYPLTDNREDCHFKTKPGAGVYVKNYTCETGLVGHEREILRHIATHGPLSVTVDATNWMQYQGGIIRYHCGAHANNHAVLIVGFDTSGEIPYYIVKNSWGSDWGIDGYIHIEIGSNICGIAERISRVWV